MKTIFFLLLTISYYISSAVVDTLHINKYDTLINGESTSLCSFNSSDNFSTINKHIKLNINDSLVITVFNNDSLEHTFSIEGILESNNIIQPNSSNNFVIRFNELGTFRYYSNESYGKLIGASGIISVINQPDIHYYWNLFDIQANASQAISNGTSNTYPIDYTPNLFTINGYFYPNTTSDSTGFVQQNLGDTIFISIINSGNMDHVLHFHGYHIEILDAKKSSNMVGWIKDTFPIKKGEAMTVKLIPHQTGMFPVHDHNLINVTNAGTYPGGMITSLNIQ